MIAPRVNGRRIADYKDVTVRETGLAVVEAEPLYRGGVSDGYRVDDFIVDDSLVWNIPLYRLLGTTFNSIDRNEITATVTGALWRPNGRLFNGVNNRIALGNRNLGTLFGADYTFEFWATTETLADTRYILGSPVFANSMLFIRGVAAGNLNAGSFLGGGDTNSAGLVINTWYHIVFQVIAATGQFYINGAASGVPGLGNMTLANAHDMFLARGHGANNWKDLIGEFRAYDRGLSLVEIVHNFNATRWRYQ